MMDIRQNNPLNKAILNRTVMAMCGMVLVVSGCQKGISDQGAPSSASPQAIASDSADSQPFATTIPSSSDADTEGSETGDSLNGDNLPAGILPPDILPSTTEAGRLAQVQKGRSNPFESLPTTPYLVQSAQANRPGALIPASTPQSLPSIPVLGTPQSVIPVPLSPIPPAPIAGTVPVASMPTAAIQAAPSASPIPSSSAQPSIDPPQPGNVVEFSGVVQMGDRVSLIVKEPGASSSRYVYVGDSIANGQFIVKAVDFNRGPTPAVILDQAGTEVVHWVGSSVGI